MRECSKCGVEKTLDEFYKQKGCRQGRRRDCKECVKAKARDDYAADPKKFIARASATYWRDPETRKAYARAYNAANKGTERRRLWDQRHNARRRARIAAAVPQRWRKSEAPEHLCYWCGCDLAETVTHIEHLMPISLGGPAEAYNEAPACEACNLAKSNTHPLVWLAHQF